MIVNASDEEFASYYEQVQDELALQLTDIENVSLEICVENERNTLQSWLWTLSGSGSENKDGNSSAVNRNFWMFLTDDCVMLISLWELFETAESAFGSYGEQNSGPFVRAFLSRLHPGIAWCQTQNKPSPRPPNLFQYYRMRTTTQSSSEFCLYPLHRALSSGSDWSYLWDLSGGLYKLSTVQKVLRRIKSEYPRSLSHPNLLEVAGNRALADDKDCDDITNKTIVAIPAKPFLVVMAINRVQSVFRAPLACKDELSVEALETKKLLNFLRTRQHLDLDRYRSQSFWDLSSHIGDIWLYSQNETKATPNANLAHKEETIMLSSIPSISVLIPVRSGPPDAAAHAILSIILQPIEEYESSQCLSRTMSSAPVIKQKNVELMLSPMQIVIVDDNCIDGSIDMMIKTAKQMVKTRHPGNDIQLEVYDRRFPTIIPNYTNDAINPKNQSTALPDVSISIEICSSPNVHGLSSALNYGLSQCRSDLVARMDADDISCPGRLLAQKKVMVLCPKLDVVGTFASLFKTKNMNERGGRREQKIEMSIHSCLDLPYFSNTAKQNSSDKDDIDNSDAETISIRPVWHPTSPGLLSWAMLFSCCIAHPSVMFRKKSIEYVGGYDESKLYAEDYDLWLRLVTRSALSCGTVGTLPNIGIYHRKHPSTSVRQNTNSRMQAQEALDISWTAVKKIILAKKCQDNDKEHSATISIEKGRAYLAILRKPSDTVSPEELDDAAEFLLMLEKDFLRYYQNNLSTKEVTLIQRDCDSRIGELATLSVPLIDQQQKSHRVWSLWQSRCPHLRLERLALLCSKKTS